MPLFKFQSLKFEILIFLLLFFSPVVKSACYTGCASCFGTGSNQCLSCTGGKYIQAFTCVSSCDTAQGYMLDSYDSTCKKSRYKFEHECPQGTYNIAPKKTGSTDCIDCPAGYFCPGLAYAANPMPCRSGYYCLSNAYWETSDDATQDKTIYCKKGYYCPTASPSPIECPLGNYCAKDRLSAVSGLCDAGYICTGMKV